MTKGLSATKEVFLLTGSILSFVADVIGIVTFLALGNINPLIITGFTILFGIFLLAVTVDYIANNKTYPKLQSFIRFLSSNKVIAYIFVCFSSAILGFVFAGLMISIYVTIAKPNMTDSFVRDEFAMNSVMALTWGTLICGSLPFMLGTSLFPFYIFNRFINSSFGDYSEGMNQSSKRQPGSVVFNSQPRSVKQRSIPKHPTILSQQTRYHHDNNRAIVTLEIYNETEHDNYFVDIQYVVVVSKNVRDVRNIRKVIKNLPKGTFPIEFVIAFSEGEFLIEKTVKVVEFKKYQNA